MSIENASCKSCKNSNLTLVYDFGMIPHVNKFYSKAEKEKEKTYPLRLAVCNECFLLQLLDHISNEDMFLDYYHRSSASKDNLKYLNHLANYFFSKHKDKKILEIGSNDLTMINLLQKKNINAFGVEPAKNLFKNQKKVFNDFLNLKNVEKILNDFGRFDLIFGINVFAHNSNFKELFDASHKLLNNNGELHIEVAYALKTVLQGNYDTIYHEHFCSYTLISLTNVLSSVGFQIMHAEELDTQGGSLRVVAIKSSSKVRPSKSYKNLYNQEINTGLNDLSFYLEVAKKIHSKNKTIESFFNQNNENLVFIGAPGRGVVTLNTQKNKLKNNIVFLDDTPEKQGLFFPGLNFIIDSWNDELLNRFDLAFILSWNYSEFLIERLKKSGFKGKVVIPFPEFEIITL